MVSSAPASSATAAFASPVPMMPDEDALAGSEPSAGDEREVHGEVVHRQRRAGLEAHRVRQGEGQRIGAGDLLGEPTEEGEGRDPVAHGIPTAGADGTDDPGDFAPRSEGWVGLHLVLPAREQHIREAHSRGADVDDDTVLGRGRCVEVLGGDRGRSGEFGDPGSAHET